MNLSFWSDWAALEHTITMKVDVAFFLWKNNCKDIVSALFWKAQTFMLMVKHINPIWVQFFFLNQDKSLQIDCKMCCSENDRRLYRTLVKFCHNINYGLSIIHPWTELFRRCHQHLIGEVELQYKIWPFDKKSDFHELEFGPMMEETLILELRTAQNGQIQRHRQKVFFLFSDISVLLMNTFLYEYQWTLLEKMTIIDRDLKRHFSVYFPYALFSR